MLRPVFKSTRELRSQLPAQHDLRENGLKDFRREIRTNIRLNFGAYSNYLNKYASMDSYDCNTRGSFAAV